MGRRKLFENEVGVNPENEEQMKVLADILEIEADGGNSGADFVAFAIKKMDAEMVARRAERRATECRKKVIAIDGLVAKQEGSCHE